MKAKVITLLIVLLAIVTPVKLDAACKSGGPGESSCSFKTSTTVLGLHILTIERSISGCPDGTYACCKVTSVSCQPEDEQLESVDPE